MQVDFGAGESDHSIHLTPHAHTHGHPHSHPHFEHSSHTSPGFSPFRHPAAPSIDPGLDQSATPSRNGHQPMTSVHQPAAAQGHLLPPDNASLNSPHLAHTFYADMSRTSQTPSTPSNSSPRFSNISPGPSQSKQLPNTSYPPTDRPAPSRHASDDTLDDAYATFILYCNPNFATDTDTAELIRQFRTPPKSDGKAFSTWALFELIRKFDAKEIKTWTQLALDLGVEPPDTDKGQSTQKVQQYSVRLKRWMRAMHIDAFFEYMLGKQHPYYLQIPPPHNPFPEGGRDGVSLGEDLAIRALDPKFRPKRGRRKADEGDDELDMTDSTPPRKRPQLDTSVPFGNVLQPQSAYPTSAHPDNMDGFLSANDPWATSGITPSSAMTSAPVPGRLHRNLTPYSASPLSGQQIRWRVNTQDNPTTPHPLSAVTPQSAHPDFFDEPQSAVTPSSSSKPRARRRHGPAVSSAWPSNNTSSTGKLRGRPPSNRSVRDGPFVTFPANPKTKEGPPIEMNRASGNLTPIVERAQSDPPVDPSQHQQQQQQQQHFRFPPTPASAVSPTNIDAQLQNSSSSQRPHRLSLQVPKNVGNPVHLVTPTVLVNGEEDPTPSTAMASSATGFSASTDRSSPYLRNDPSPSHHHHHHHQLQQQTPSRSHPSSAISPHQQQRPPTTTLSPQPQPHPTQTTPHLPPDALHRALVAEIIRAPLSGRRKRLRGHEAKNIAAAILSPILPPPSSSSSPSTTNVNPLIPLVIASCLGLAANLPGLLPPPTATHDDDNDDDDQQHGAGWLAGWLLAAGPRGGVKKVECVRFRVGGDGFESPVDEDDDDEDDAGGGAGSSTTTRVRRGGNVEQRQRQGEEGESIVKETFDVYFSVGFGDNGGGVERHRKVVGSSGVVGGVGAGGANHRGGVGLLVGEWVARGISALPIPSPSPVPHPPHSSRKRRREHDNDDDDDDDILDVLLDVESEDEDEGGGNDDGNDDDNDQVSKSTKAAIWKRRFLEVRKRLKERTEEVRRVREGVLDVALF